MVVALDQLTKSLVKDRIVPGDHVDVFPGLQLSNVRNTGVAFGALEGAGLIVAVLIALSLTLLIAYFVVNRDVPLLWLPVGMLVGGAAGNLVDRAREGAVVDFIDPVALARVQPGRQLHRRRGVCCSCGWSRGSATSRVELTAGAADAGTRLDAFLAAHGRAASRAAAQRLVDAGLVSVDGARRAKSHRMAAGEVVAVDEPEASAPAAADVEFEVVYEDADLMVVDKPAGLVVHPAPGHAGTTLAEALRGRAAGGADPERAGIVHRLDRDTSGLLVVAKTEAAHAELVAMLARREIERGYIALVSGHPDAASGTIDAALGRDRSRRDVVSTRTARGRAAITHFERPRAAAAHRAARRAARDRAHPSDPGPPRRDRPSGVRRPPLRGPRMRHPAWTRAPIPARSEVDV